MNILVCVKRVPETGGRVSLTADAREIDTRYLGFTVSPHEECATEEAVRLIEANGGSSTVLTLGPEAASDQLRAAMAIGIDRAILLETDGQDWDPVATAAAIVEAIRAEAAAGHRLRPHPVRQRGRRFGRLPGRDPGRPGPRPALDQRGEVARDPGRRGHGPARGRRRLGGLRGAPPGGRRRPRRDQPAALSIGPGPAPGEEEGDRDVDARRLRSRVGPTKIRLRLPAETEGRVEILGTGAEAAPAVVDLLERIGVLVGMILAFVEQDGGRPDRSSLEALTVRPAPGGVRPGRAARRPSCSGRTPRTPRPRLGAYGVRPGPCRGRRPDRRLRPGGLGPEPSPSSSRSLAPSIVARGGHRPRPGGPRLRRRDERRADGRQLHRGPARPRATFEVTRQRWGGSLLEEARLDGTVRFAHDRRACDPARGGRALRRSSVAAVHADPVRGRPAGPGRRPGRAGGRQGLAGRCAGRRRRRPRRRRLGGILRARGAGRPAPRGGRRVPGRDQRRLAAAQPAGRPDRDPDRARTSTSPAESAARSSTSSAARPPSRSS